MNVHHLAIGCALLAAPPSAAAQHATRLPAARVAQPDTVRYVEIVDDQIVGGWSVWRESADTWGYASELAGLIIVDGDPTVDIRDIRRVVTVIKDGRVYDPAAIYRALGIEPRCGR